MKVFNNPRAAEYRPRHSFFIGRFVTYPETPERKEAS